jgi:CBS domain-containing protein
MPILARDVMQSRVVTVEPSLPATELERLLEREGISGAPVIDEGGRLLGVVSRADLVSAAAGAEDEADSLLAYYEDVAGAASSRGARAQLAGERIASLRVRDLVQTELVSVAPDTPVQKVAAALAERRIHRVLVVDGERLVGLVSSLDLVRLLAEGRVVER